jgi:hypothetical protein
MKSLGTRVFYLTVLALFFLVGCIVWMNRVNDRPVAPASADKGATANFSKQLDTDFRTKPAAKALVREQFGQLPLFFEANRGQTDERVKFLARGGGYNIFLTGAEATLTLLKNDGGKSAKEKTKRDASFATLRLKFAGANPQPHVAELEELPGKVNYFIGNDPLKWRTNIPTYAKVEYRDVYPGVNLVYYGQQRQLEYDLIVAPGADPRAIKLGFEGADKVEIDAQGDLVLHVAGEQIRQRRPVVYQEADGVRRDVSGGYVMQERGQVGFQLGEYDFSKPLVIDPVLIYSTYLGGSFDDDAISLAVDTTGNAYIGGGTNSPNFVPSATTGDTGCGTDGNCNGTKHDGFVMKLKPEGTLGYFTYLGGGEGDNVDAIAIDTMGNAYVVGGTASSNFPIPLTINPFQRLQGSAGSFVAKLSSDGSQLIYSTFFGGNGLDPLQRIAADNSGNAYIVGTTSSMDLLTTTGAFQPTHRGGTFDAFAMKLNTNPNPPTCTSVSGTDIICKEALVYATYLGGTRNDHGEGIFRDTAGNVYVSGRTESYDDPSTPLPADEGFPTTMNAYDRTCGINGQCDGSTGNKRDAFVTKLNLAGAGAADLIYSTYLGGSHDDYSFGVAVAAGNIYLSGTTRSADFPTRNAYQNAHSNSGSDDVFVARLNPALMPSDQLVYSTYLGGSGQDFSFGDIAVDNAGHACVTGNTSSTNFPITSGAFVAKLNTDPPICTSVPGTNISCKESLLCSTYLGGTGGDGGLDVGLDAVGNIYVIGSTNSVHNLPTSEGFPVMNPLRSNFGGESDAFATKIKVEEADLAIAKFASSHQVQSPLARISPTQSLSPITGRRLRHP